MPRLPDGATNHFLTREDESGERARRLQRILFDGGFAGICFPVAYGGPGSVPGPPAGIHPGVGAVSDADGIQRPHLFHPRPDVARLRNRGTEAATCPGHAPRRRVVGAVPVRAQRRFGPGRPGHPGHPGRRRLHPQRIEDLELGCLPLRLFDVPGPHRLASAQAPGPHHVHHEDPSARRRDTADQDGERDGGILSGVLRRRPDPGRPTLSARSTTAGRSPPGCSITSATRWGVGRRS